MLIVYLAEVMVDLAFHSCLLWCQISKHKQTKVIDIGKYYLNLVIILFITAILLRNIFSTFSFRRLMRKRNLQKLKTANNEKLVLIMSDILFSLLINSFLMMNTASEQKFIIYVSLMYTIIKSIVLIIQTF